MLSSFLSRQETARFRGSGNKYGRGGAPRSRCKPAVHQIAQDRADRLRIIVSKAFEELLPSELTVF